MGETFNYPGYDIRLQEELIKKQAERKNTILAQNGVPAN